HQAAVGDRQAGHVVTAAAHGYLGGLLASDVHCVGHVGDGAAPGDEPWTPVDQPVVHPADLVVSRVGVADQLTGEGGPYLVGNGDRVVHVVCPLAVGVLPDHCDLSGCRRRVTGVSPTCHEHGPACVTMRKGLGGNGGRVGVRAPWPGRGV